MFWPNVLLSLAVIVGLGGGAYSVSRAIRAERPKPKVGWYLGALGALGAGVILVLLAGFASAIVPCGPR